MSVDIQGMLNAHKRRKITIMEDDNGNRLTDQQARIHLHNLQIQGHKLMSCSPDCLGFDPFEKGCPGHPIPDDE